MAALKGMTTIEEELNESKDRYTTIWKSFLDPKIYNTQVLISELKTLEWWISRLMLDPLFLLISLD